MSANESLSPNETTAVIHLAKAAQLLRDKREHRVTMLATLVLDAMSDEQVDRALRMLAKLSRPSSHGSPKE